MSCFFVQELKTGNESGNLILKAFLDGVIDVRRDEK